MISTCNWCGDDLPTPSRKGGNPRKTCSRPCRSQLSDRLGLLPEDVNRVKWCQQELSERLNRDVKNLDLIRAFAISQWGLKLHPEKVAEALSQDWSVEATDNNV